MGTRTIAMFCTQALDIRGEGTFGRARLHRHSYLQELVLARRKQVLLLREILLDIR